MINIMELNKFALSNPKVPTKVLDIWTNTLDFLGQAWWIEVFTAQPKCTYYFGPFAHVAEAEGAIEDYIEDLEAESAQGIQTQIKRCKPHELTIEHDLLAEH
jgi:Domain of unknown function (DUF1816)